METVLVKEMSIEEELQQIRNDMFLSLDQALTAMNGKYVHFSSWNGLMVDVILPTFDYNCHPNCKDELLLDFKDEDENILGASIKLDMVEDIEIDNTVFECVKIDLENGQTIRLQVEF